MSPGPSLPQGKDFDALFQETCESTMKEVLGENGMRSVSWWLDRWGVDLSSSSLRPEEFDDALVHLFQPMGAILIEARILGRFYRAQGASYRKGDSLNFAKEIEEARRLFDGTQNSMERDRSRARDQPPPSDPE